MATLIPAMSACVSRMTSLRDEAFAIADEMGNAHQDGHAWGDMAILCHDYPTMDLCAKALEQRKLPFNVRKRAGDFNPRANAIQIMTMKVSKGLEFPVVALPGVGHMPAAGEDEKEAARVFYVAATRATQRLVWVGVGGLGGSYRSSDSVILCAFKSDSKREATKKGDKTGDQSN